MMKKTIMNRRAVLGQAAAGTLLLSRLAPASATPEALQAALAAFTGGAPIQTGRVRLVARRTTAACPSVRVLA